MAVLLASPDVRLLSIVGPGGMGKTRLALAAAEAQRAQWPRTFSNGIAFVDLAPLSSPDFIVPAIAETLGLELAVRRGDERSPMEKLLEFLRPRQMLLILDDLEHLLRAGAAGQLPLILHGAPAVKLLTTSRERLNLREEHVCTLSGMRYPAEPSEGGRDSPEGYAAEVALLSLGAPLYALDSPSRLARRGAWRRSAGRWRGCRWRWSWPQPGWTR